MTVRRQVLTTAVAVVLSLAAVQDAVAQDGFLFGRPDFQLTVRTGPVLHQADSDIFDFITSELTLDRGDFRAPAIGAEAAWSVHPRLDLSIGAAWSQTEKRSEFRDWYEEVDGDSLGIAQSTALQMVPVSLSARFYPFSRGRSVSSLAWLPARTTPYLGAGMDMTWYRLRQVGDFVDPDGVITYQEYETSGRAATMHARVGLDHWLTPKLGLNIEGRYTHGSAEPSDDFGSFDSLDLSGFNAGIGISVRW
ncbi:MAG: hypothetical protein WEF86_06280 [Gemmatimonadota bacterium]